MPKIYYNKFIPASTDENTLALLHFDDENDVAKDECGNEWTVYGSPTVQTDANVFNGRPSLWLNGSSYLKTDGILLPQTFTVEARIKTGSTVPSTSQILGQHRYGSTIDWGFIIWSGTLAFDSGFKRNTTMITPNANTEYHLAACVDSSNVLRCFVDGVSVAQVTVSETRYNRSAFTVGASENPSLYFSGYIEFVRISNICRWTENFTPPTAPYVLQMEDRLVTKSIEVAEVED